MVGVVLFYRYVNLGDAQALRTSDLQVRVQPADEWREVFVDAWRQSAVLLPKDTSLEARITWTHPSSSAVSPWLRAARSLGPRMRAAMQAVKPRARPAVVARGIPNEM